MVMHRLEMSVLIPDSSHRKQSGIKTESSKCVAHVYCTVCVFSSHAPHLHLASLIVRSITNCLSVSLRDVITSISAIVPRKWYQCYAEHIGASYTKCCHVITVFCQINALGAEAENEPLYPCLISLKLTVWTPECAENMIKIS